jgi:hypothetical protein
MLIGLCLSHLPPVGVGVEAVISHRDLAFGWVMPITAPDSSLNLISPSLSR